MFLLVGMVIVFVGQRWNEDQGFRVKEEEKNVEDRRCVGPC